MNDSLSMIDYFNEIMLQDAVQYYLHQVLSLL